MERSTQPTDPAEAAGAALDPVCGMTVTPSPDGISAEHDGATYWFCAAICREG